jgi:GT2 family glycosyltransferase
VLVKAEVFRDIGLMDDGYFMYFEDVAFAYHAQQAGWKVLNVPEANVVHLRGGSSPVKSQAKQRKRLPRYYYESRTRYFYQVYGQLGLLMANIFWSLGFVISSLRSLLSSSFNSNISAYQWRDIWTNFFTPLRPYIHPDKYDKT